MDINLTLTKSQKEKMQILRELDPHYVIFPAGRRYGKSEFAVRWQLKHLLSVKTTEDSPHSWCSPIYRTAKLGFFKYRKLLTANKVPHRASLSSMSIDLFHSDKFRVQFFSLDKPEGMEGYSFKSLVMDESGIMLKRREAWEHSVLPATMDYLCPVLFIGTPKGKGLYHELYLKGLDTQNKDYLSLHATSYDNSIENGGHIESKQIDLILRNLPERAAKQEIFAEFLDDGGMVFRNTKECIKGKAVHTNEAGVLVVKPYDKTKKYIAGLDVAKVNDWTVLTIGTPDGEICYIERFNQLDWSVQKERAKKACKEYNAKLIMDSTGVGDPILEDLKNSRMAVEGYHFTAQSKKALIDKLVVAIENKSIILPNWDTLINEFDAYEYDITAAGNIRMNAASGFHDDIVISVALYNWQVNNGISQGDAIDKISFGGETASSAMDW